MGKASKQTFELEVELTFKKLLHWQHTVIGNVGSSHPLYTTLPNRNLALFYWTAAHGLYPISPLLVFPIILIFGRS